MVRTGKLKPLVVLAMVLVVLGTGLSYFGYSESLQVVTETSTRPYTTTIIQPHVETTVRPIVSVSTETVVITTGRTVSLFNESFDVSGSGSFSGQSGYCGEVRWVESMLVTGQIHVSYLSVGKTSASREGKVDFWLATYDQWSSRAPTASCGLRLPGSIVQRSDSNRYEFNATIPSSGAYVFAFLNNNVGAVTVTLNVDYGVAQSEVTETRKQVSVSTETLSQTSYLTQQIPTQTVSFSSHMMGLGSLFFAGVALLAIGIIALVASLARRTQTAPQPPPPPPARPARAEPAAQKFCISCGAPLSMDSTFCNKCGSPQQPVPSSNPPA